MSQFDRRSFLASAAATAAGFARAAEAAPDLAIAPFGFDATPPVGHGCCGGWIKPVEAVDDAAEALGFVLLGAGKPVVVCAVDWTGVLNSAHVEFRAALADAAGTTPDRVAVQCVHQHNAPFACLDSQKLIAEQGDLPATLDVDFFRRTLDLGRKTVADAVKKARRVTHVATGKAKVDKVAGNRRIARGPDGRVTGSRTSACRNPELVALPEGLIDPWLRTVAFFDKDTKLAACHYYATHPMSYYGDGRVTADFVGLARKKRQAEEPGCRHVYFTGAAGNVTAGKYNDGSKENRPVLTGRMYDAIVAADKTLKPEPVASAVWKAHDILPPVRAGVTAEELAEKVANKKNPVAGRNRPAMQLAWMRRVEKKVPITLSALHVNDATLLHLPAESFVEYQLRAQQIAPKRFVATAAYGDGGPWYIPVKEEYPAGGYEVSVAFCDPGVDDELTKGMKALLS